MAVTSWLVLLALGAFVVFGIAGHVQRIALDHMDVRSGTIVNIATTATIMWLLAPLFGLRAVFGSAGVIFMMMGAAVSRFLVDVDLKQPE